MESRWLPTIFRQNCWQQKRKMADLGNSVIRTIIISCKKLLRISLITASLPNTKVWKRVSSFYVRKTTQTHPNAHSTHIDRKGNQEYGMKLSPQCISSPSLNIIYIMRFRKYRPYCRYWGIDYFRYFLLIFRHLQTPNSKLLFYRNFIFWLVGNDITDILIDRSVFNISDFNKTSDCDTLNWTNQILDSVISSQPKG